MVATSGPVVKAVLIILVLLSLGTWAVGIFKVLQLRRASKESEEFSNLFWETRNFTRVDDSSRRLEASPLAHIFSAGFRELSHLAQRSEDIALDDPDDKLRILERVLRRAEHQEYLKLDIGNTFLATVASAAPFIGLFGTVWGIMTAFQGLSNAKAATIQAVAPGISEALIATAVGLAAAIPAAIAYNYFAAAVKNFRASMDRFSLEFLNLAKRYMA
ncbi:MAG: MotA/TolQ/ExbB proton channel family protein [Bdellovibrionales bacterium]|nr:MotA/TolQ/ExbB proton channel family protein [Bdellovibrionales bacterium]